ncbi:MAG: GH116 family glycosyl-hydrolase [Bryobacteraceae bacterium]
MQTLSLASGVAPSLTAVQTPPAKDTAPATQARPPRVRYPRVFTHEKLAMLAFPLGGVAAGSISLGGRGNLRDWEIFNRPDKGLAPGYALPSLWVQMGNAKPVARVLEARYLPPYEGSSGLGSDNAPGLRRMEGATFTGQYPLAHIAFRDARVPVKVSLEAFSPFIPHNADDSGLPVAILRYKVRNPTTEAAKVSIAWSLENMAGQDGREALLQQQGLLHGVTMSNPALPADHERKGSFTVAVLDDAGGNITSLRGWPLGRWWNSPMLFWDDFTADGLLGPEAAQRGPVGAICLQREIPAGAEVEYTFLLTWHYPNRTPERCGWRASKGDEKVVIGNWYSARFPDAWAAAVYAAENLPRLEKATKQFATALRDTTLPPAVKEAASANFSTLATQTCFRTADGEFHGFEGCSDHQGCCTGNCTHVWNYETTTAYLFPSLAKSLRKAAYGHSVDEDGAMHFRQVLPDGKERSGFAAADGQMGQLIHTYMDYLLSGDLEWLRAIYPTAKKTMEYCWLPGSWDADRDGVMEGVQHNTYDVEFYGPNPQCGIYYLGGLCAMRELALAVGDDAMASECARLFESGRQWIDANLFNGEYYIQKVRGLPREKIIKTAMSSMGSADTQNPEYQVGDGCLVDQMVGQYLAEVAGLGALVDPAHCRKTLQSIYRYNYKRNLYDHDSVQRIFALNDEAAIIICDYGKGTRPHIPFPYWAEVMTGFEYSAATHMMYAGMVKEGVECVENIRARYDGERRNPWNEAECGHHYARAMAAWSGVLALSGFRYDGAMKEIEALPRWKVTAFQSIWMTATGWGMFQQSGGKTTVHVLSGRLPLRSAIVPAGAASATLDGQHVPVKVTQAKGQSRLQFVEDIVVAEGGTLVFQA